MHVILLHSCLQLKKITLCLSFTFFLKVLILILGTLLIALSLIGVLIRIIFFYLGFSSILISLMIISLVKITPNIYLFKELCFLSQVNVFFIICRKLIGLIVLIKSSNLFIKISKILKIEVSKKFCFTIKESLKNH